jgi:hypothetical protein
MYNIQAFVLFFNQYFKYRWLRIATLINFYLIKKESYTCSISIPSLPSLGLIFSPHLVKMFQRSLAGALLLHVRPQLGNRRALKQKQKRFNIFLSKRIRSFTAISYQRPDIGKLLQNLDCFVALNTDQLW